jgi:ATP-binding cassette, subfamily A (ABC1), member 3
VFTLLGVNGAGKSTTFKCLVGLEPISSGKVIMNGDIDLNDTYSSPEVLHGVIGYCPQTDCIDPSLTVRKTLEFFASLVGYP